jgi:hypothetical protein
MLNAEHYKEVRPFVMRAASVSACLRNPSTRTMPLGFFGRLNGRRDKAEALNYVRVERRHVPTRRAPGGARLP